MGAGAWPAGASPADGHQSSFRQVNLVSDVPGAAQLLDADLVNAWGLAASPGTDATPGSPLWVSDNGSDKSTLYSSGTATSVTKAGLTVNIVVLFSLILAVFLPPVLYQAALFTSWRDFKRFSYSISTLAIGLVIYFAYGMRHSRLGSSE